MEIGLKSLSNVIIWSKYAKYIPELKRRETWDEIIDRYEVMMMKKYPSESILIIRDAMGKVIIEKSISIEEGINLYPISSTELQNGIYFITIENQNAQSKTIKHSKN
jgi:hypothetical protein